MSELFKHKNTLPRFNTLDSPSVLSKLINNESMGKRPEVARDTFRNVDDGDPVLFHYSLNESLEDAWDRLLQIQASHIPPYHIELYLKGFLRGAAPLF